MSVAAALSTYRKNSLALDIALEPLGGPSVRTILESNLTAAGLLDLLAEKGVELRIVAGPAEAQKT